MTRGWMHIGIALLATSAFASAAGRAALRAIGGACAGTSADDGITTSCTCGRGENSGVIPPLTHRVWGAFRRPWALTRRIPPPLRGDSPE